MKSKTLSAIGTFLFGLSFLELVSYGVGLIGAILFAIAQYYAFQKSKTESKIAARKLKDLEEKEKQ